jgi:hypothetical protein
MTIENRYKLTTNIKAKRYGGTVPLVTANDNTVFEIELFDDATTFSLTGATRYTLVTYKKNKTSVIREGSLVNGLIVFTLGASETTESGRVEATVQIYDSNNKRISSAPIVFEVVKDPSTSGGLPTDDKTLVIANESLMMESIEKADLANGRIDTIVAQAGTDNTEIVDLRVRPDGTSAASAGAHVRELSSALAQKTTDILKYTSGVAGTNETAAFTALENDIKHTFVDLQGKTYRVNAIPKGNFYRNGYFDIVGGVNEVYPTADLFPYETIKLTDNSKYSAWAQDKCFEVNGKLVFMYNEGSAHIANDLLPKFKISEDGGKTWSEEKILYKPTAEEVSLYSGGVTCWGAGSDGTRIYAIIRFRGDTYASTVSKHKLLVYTLGGTTIGMKDIDITKNGNVPVLYHSFASWGSGKIAFGYQYEDGEVGIISSVDVGDTWSTHIIYTSAEMGSTMVLVEPTLYYDAPNNKIVGFLRTQNTGTSYAKFFITDTTFSSFSITDVTNLFLNSAPIPIKKLGDYYIAAPMSRGSGGFYLLIGKAVDVLSQGYTAFKKYRIGEMATDSGAPSMVVDRFNNVHIFYTRSDAVNTQLYDTILKLNINTPVAAVHENARLLTVKKSTEPKHWEYTNANLLNGWEMQSGVLKLSLKDGIAYITGELKWVQANSGGLTTPDSKALFMLPTELIPSVNVKGVTVSGGTSPNLFTWIAPNVNHARKGELYPVKSTVVAGVEDYVNFNISYMVNQVNPYPNISISDIVTI